MRTLAALVLAFAVAGCGDSSSTPTVDAAQPVNDLSMHVSADLSMQAGADLSMQSTDDLSVASQDLSVPIVGDAAVGSDLASVCGQPCAGQTPFCDPVSMMCAACVLGGNDPCAAGSYCAAGINGAPPSCQAGCKVDGDCATDAGAGACCNHMCVNESSDPANCGACGVACNASCCDGKCADPTSDVNNCGGCGMACPPLANVTTLTCVASTCGVGSCAMGFADCNQNPGDGCEVNLLSDPMNCTMCGAVCNVPNAMAGCMNGCVVGGCNNGFADCDGNAQNGCEVNSATDNMNCGMCGTVCPAVANGNAVCSGGACGAGTCNPGFADCDMNPNNGCETATSSDVMNCGGCKMVCAIANGSAVCTNSKCAVASCKAPFLDCDMNSANGCEANTQTDPNHCGSCNGVCGAIANGTASCAAGKCGIGSCNAGFLDCDGNAANGCEVNSKSDVLHCGGCGTVCPGVEPSCTNGVCGITNFASCKDILSLGKSTGDGLYSILPPGVQGPAFNVYCDMTRDGGGWTLLEIGKALSTNLRVQGAVGSVTGPSQQTSAKLDRSISSAILVTGDLRLKWGAANYGYLYSAPLQAVWIQQGLGAISFGTVVESNLIATDVNLTHTYAGSRFAWPLASMPAGCLNSDGSQSECGGGLHVGTWACCGWTPDGDNAYVNNAVCCNIADGNGYEVWGR